MSLSVRDRVFRELLRCHKSPEGRVTKLATIRARRPNLLSCPLFGGRRSQHLAPGMRLRVDRPFELDMSKSRPTSATNVFEGRV
jgi:hypothetical protein